MTDADERELSIDLDFLKDGNYQILLYEDTNNANEFPAEVIRRDLQISNQDHLTIQLVKDGGFVAVVEPIEE